MTSVQRENTPAKPFLKWAGGKGQLLPAIAAALPHHLLNSTELTYIEPFIGSGAMMFWFLQQYPQVKKAVINDINSDLTQAYSVIRDQPHQLIKELKAIHARYTSLNSEQDRKLFYLEQRELFNARQANAIHNTVLLIFLNKTCFNGLYRVNSKNKFNVPFGRYNNPGIYDPETILANSALLQKVEILNGDYQQTLAHATQNTFFYFDPPYKPISKTASFNSYARDTFDDAEQKRLKAFCDLLTEKGYKWLLSNSDPKNTNPEDNFFDDLFAAKTNVLTRVKAKRSINSNASKRGEIFELLISNYPRTLPTS